MIYQSGWYMASSGSIDSKYNNTIGIIQNVGNLNNGFYTARLDAGVPICLDNQIYTDRFDVDEWLKAIEKIKKYKEQCLFVVIPDVFGDCKTTIQQFSYYRNMVKDLPVAFVAQDGIMDYADEIPWDDFDCMFIGGHDEHRLGKSGGWILEEAKSRNKWIHIGRVNSISRILKFWQADSWDGTHLNYQPYYAGRFHEAVLQVRALKKSPMFDLEIKDYLDFTDWIGLAHPDYREEDDAEYCEAIQEYISLFGAKGLQ